MIFNDLQLKKYLIRNGWENKKGTWKIEWEDEGYYLTIPSKNDLNYNESINHLLGILSETEKRNVKNIIEDIQVN